MRHHLVSNSPLLGKRVLIVEEDDRLYGALTSALRDAGCETFGAVGLPGDALFLFPKCRLDAALLDINLRTPAALRLVERLNERGVPLLLVSADPPAKLPPSLRDEPRLGKPFTEEELLESLTRAINLAHA